MTTIAELKQRAEEFLETDSETTMTITLSHHLGHATYSVRAKEFLESLKENCS